jgi:hypothetical protein
MDLDPFSIFLLVAFLLEHRPIVTVERGFMSTP